MSINNIIMAVAGFMTMLSIALGMANSPVFQDTAWLYLGAFVGFNLFQSAFTGFCPLAMILKAVGVKS